MRPFERLHHARQRQEDDGFTLVEMLIASTLLIILMTLVFVTMTSFTNASLSVTGQFQEFDQLGPATAQLRVLIRAEAEPAPATSTTAPVPGFGVDTTTASPNTIAGLGNYGMWFYANNSSVIPTGYAGPAKIWAGLTTQAGVAITTPTATQCVVRNPCNFQVKEYEPSTSPSNTCPGTGTGTACTYPSSYKLITNVGNVVNTSTQPIFSYQIFDPVLNGTFVLSSTDITNGTHALTTAQQTTYGGLTSLSLTSCKPATASPSAPTTITDPVFVMCPADGIQRVAIDLFVKVQGDKTAVAEDNTLVYRVQGNSVAPTLPFQYSASVG